MRRSPREIFEDHCRLVRGLGPVVSRGPLQEIYAAPVLPEVGLEPEVIRRAWADLCEAIRRGEHPELINFYVHIPFCSHRCRYCIYHSTADHTAGDRTRYVDRLLAELDGYAELLSGLRLASVYLGGGTPTVLEPELLRRLLAHLTRRFGRRPGGSWDFELNPLTATAERVALFAEHGFNRASFGVQSFDPTALGAVNRAYQTVAMVERTLGLLHEHRFFVNVDLIHGLPGEGAEAVAATAARLLAMGATQLTVYQLSPHTPSGRLRERAAAALGLGELSEILTPVVAPLGARVRVGDTNLSIMADAPAVEQTRLAAERKEAGEIHCYDDITPEPYSLLGVGPTARSYVYGRLAYRMEPYPATDPFDPAAVIARGRRLSRSEEQRRFVLYHLSSREGLDAARYESLFGEPLETLFGEALEATGELALRESHQGRLRLTPTDPVERFAAALFFVEEARLKAVRDSLVSPDDFATGEAAAPARMDPVDLLLTLEQGQLLVRLVRAGAGQQCYDSRGGIAFFEVSDPNLKGSPPPGLKQAVLQAFRQRFRQLVDRTAPTSTEDLACALLAGSGRFRLTSRRQPGRVERVRITRPDG